METRKIVLALHEVAHQQERMAKFVMRKRSMRDSEKAMTAAHYIENRDAILAAIGIVTGQEAK